MSNNFSVKIFNEINDELLNNWMFLEKNSNISLFQSLSWFESWYENIFDKTKNILRVYCFYNKIKEPEVIFPLIIKKKFNLKICEFFNQNLSDYNYMLVKRGCQLNNLDIWNNLIDDLKKNCDLIHFERLPNEINGINNDLKFFNNKIIKKKSYINFSNGQNIEFLTLQKQLPSNLKRKEGNLNKVIDFCYNNIKATNYNDFMTSLFNLKIKQYKRTGARNIFTDEIICFYNHFFKKHTDIKPFLSAIVEKNSNKIIAGTFSFIYKSTFFWLFPVYDNYYKKFSPGLIYMKYLFSDLSDNYKINQFDFGVGDETYKLTLSNKKIVLYDYYKYFSVNGLFFILIYKVFYSLKNNAFLRPILMKLYSIFK